MASTREREVLRGLAARAREITELPEMPARRRRWLRHNALQPERPLILCYPEGSWRELVPASVLECEDPLLRGWEERLRQRVYLWERLGDDQAYEPFFDVDWVLDRGDYGVPLDTHRTEERGSYNWTPPLKDLSPGELSRLRFREPRVDRAETLRRMELAGELFGDLLTPRHSAYFEWSHGLTQKAIKIIGLEQMMLLMAEEPEGVHALMAFLRDEELNYLRRIEALGVLAQRNRDHYVGSGGQAYTEELPRPDWRPGQPLRLCDVWGFAESQETVGCSPAMYAEFVFPYEQPVMDLFHLNCYGCCEPVHDRMKWIAQFRGLRRVSVSPWCNQEAMAECCAGRYVFSRKPNPALVCSIFDEDACRADVRHTLNVAGRCALEVIMKDTHTVQGQPWRLERWVRIAREEVDRYMSGQK